ncbi:YciI family protein [Povalibacter sp.]|uniref:YciI family protein n=1 Tax=Povalibacter sp. TaxID=1962978 RepID=UPI002F428701
MKQYLISMYQPDGPGRPDPEFLGKVMREIHQIRDELQSQGSWVFAGGLHDVSSATVVRVRNGETLITDGPFAEGKEHLGGFTIVRVADLDAALGWAKRYAQATTLPIEVRPFMDEGGD